VARVLVGGDVGWQFKLPVWGYFEFRQRIISNGITTLVEVTTCELHNCNQSRAALTYINQKAKCLLLNPPEEQRPWSGQKERGSA